MPPAPAWIVEEAVAGIGRVVEHAAEFQRGDVFFQRGDVGLHGGERIVVVLLARHLEQFGGVLQTGCHTIEHQHHVFQRLAFAAQFLGARGVVPDIGGFRQTDYFLETILFVIVVKETP